MSSYSLPNSPIKEVKHCHKCGRVTLHFLNPKNDVIIKSEVWQELVRKGFNAMRRHMYIPKELLMLDPKFFQYRMHRNIFRNYFRKNVENGVTGVTALVTLIQLQKWVTLWCNQGVTGVTYKASVKEFFGTLYVFSVKNILYIVK